MFERDQRRLIQGKGESEGIYYQTITGMESDLSGVRTTPTLLTTKNLDVEDEDEEEEDEEEDSEKSGDSDDESDGRRRFEKPVLDKEAQGGRKPPPNCRNKPPRRRERPRFPKR